MKKRRTLLFVIICFVLGLLSNATFAQTKVIRGKVIHAIKGTPIPNIKVDAIGSIQPTQSNVNGEFEIVLNDTISKIEFKEFSDMEILEVRKMYEETYNIYLTDINLTDLSFDQLLNIKVDVSSTLSQTVFHTPSTVSVIDREMLRKYNFLSVAEMLRTAVGFDIYQTNNDDNVATARGVLQNYYANKILVMIENTPTYQPIYGNTNLDRLDVNDIERIEVLKGPASVLYGSNAYMGVVNIILRKESSDNVNVRIGTGYHRFGSAGANLVLSKKDFNLFISENTGFEIQKPYELIGKRQDLYMGDSAFLFQRELKSSNFNVLSSYKAFTLLINNYEYQHTFLGINPSFISGGGKPMYDRGTLIALKFSKQVRTKVNLAGDVSYDYFKRDYASNKEGSQALMLSGKRIIARTKFNYTISSLLDFEIGADAEKRLHGKHVTLDVLKDTIIRSNTRGDTEIDEYSAFTQLNFKTKYLKVLGGLRYTNNSFSGGNYSGRVSAVAEINKSNALKFIFGQSFRAPTMLELFFDHPTVIGNLNLKPEKANSYELAYLYGHKTVFVQMLVFYNKLEQLIQRYTPPAGPPSEYQNVASLEGYGFEFEGKYQSPYFLNAFFNYNYMAGLGSNAKSNYQHVPKHTFKFGVNRNFSDFFVSMNGYIVSSVLGNPKLNIRINSQYMFDTNIGYRHTISDKRIVVEHSFSAKNITGSQMLIPEYIRQTDNINSQATTGFGRRFIYILTVSF